MTDDKVKQLARLAGFKVGTVEINDNQSYPFVSSVGENCIVEIKKLIELARDESCMALREIASYIGVGGYNMNEPLDVQKITDRIMDEFERIRK